jgi:hypothetical protein
MARRLAVEAEEDRIITANSQRAARKADEQREAEQQWVDRENDRRAVLTEASRQAAINKPIFPRELADKIAAEYVKVSYPDWRLLKLENRGLFAQLVREQPERARPEIRQRHAILAMIRSNLPGHIVPLVRDLETVYDLIVTAQESAAFMVGYSLGRMAERAYVDEKSGILRVRRQSTPGRLALGEPGT